MDYLTFKKQKNAFLAQPVGYREIAKNEIVAVDASHFSIGNVTIELSPTADFDKQINISHRQTKLATDAYGSRGVTSLRNFFGQAASNSDERIVLIGNRENKKVTKVMSTNRHLIAPQAFFDFAELFMDSNNYEPHAVEFSRNGDDIMVAMKPVKPEYMAFADDDEFLANGLCLHWNPTEISLSNFYERLVCSNGQIQRIENKLAKTQSVMPDDIGEFLNLGQPNDILRGNIDKMIHHARIAIGTRASVRELGLGSKMLSRMGLEDSDVEKIIPYERTKAQYEQAGFNSTANELSLAVSEISVWQLFNTITAFASHNTVWAENDIRRSKLMEQGMDLLCRERDIKQYHNIFA